MKNISKQDKIDLITNYYNHELSEAEEEKVLELLNYDTEFLELFQKGEKVIEFTDRLGQDAFLQNDQILEEESQEEHLASLFKKFANEKKERRRRFVAYRKAIAAGSVFLIIVSVGFMFLLPYFLGKVQSSTQKEAILSDNNKNINRDNKEKEVVKKIPQIKEEEENITTKYQQSEIITDTTNNDELAVKPNFSQYSQNMNMEKFITGKFKGNNKGFEVEVTDIELNTENPKNLILSFTFTVDSLSKEYILEVESFDKVDMFQQKIKSKQTHLSINIDKWDNGYYYWKLKTKKKRPLAGRFLKIDKQLYQIVKSY